MNAQRDDSPMMYTDLLEQYLQHLTTTCSPATVRTYTWVLRHAHQELPAGVVNAGEDELHAWLSQPGRTAKTRDTYRCPIVGLHRWLYRRGHSSYDPGPLIPRIKVGRRLPKPTTDAETTQLLTNARQPIRTWCWVAAYAGARVIELTRICSDDWHPAGLLLRGKGDRERVVPMHPALWAILERLPAGPLVVGRFTDPRHLSSICCTEFRRLGVDGGIHRLRHWFATRALDGHGNVRTVQELLGHSSLATTQIYTAVSSAAMSEAVAGLPIIGRSSDGEAPGS